MSSIAPIRDPKNDHLLSPENAALIIIDYQPIQVSSIKSMDQTHLVEQIVRLAKTAKVYNIPVIVSTVNVQTGRNKDTIAPLKEVLADTVSYDRTSINAWEDKEFYEAVKATGRKKLIMAALWTEACLTFPALDALKEGFEVYPVVDAVGGTSSEAHTIALRRIEQAGSQLISVNQLLCELQRDWNREETVPGFFEVLFKDGKII
ncbi:Nicotinamidase-related amidase [Flavobacterium glycines]|jgi:nicotinamidase-related amidase|uniref:Hydrolase n=1 Tax=Flavobacterium glycines TaxID=551990 RepID=A0A1B9DPJ5_9FLAO|nr:hydrolase [Flavobacterium glycines]OCB71607.1 hydrolase [Flavobacterium glycines]GEL10648.1 hydrolase [Flavobacterium glycines]SDI59873.1 Nicotinamidase-related amidase [Flavobacterium glycines]